eukprot:gb/GECH01002060.1/.p1 GENE.gb/GECH01002060.1/~~gb/GECH01002060.1/.p1  ORF type:complete len:541 (+),score=119.16 gb/GECH01002060.1/:1-1623(+)
MNSNLTEDHQQRQYKYNPPSKDEITSDTFHQHQYQHQYQYPHHDESGSYSSSSVSLLSSSLSPILSRNTSCAMHVLSQSIPAALEEASRRHRTAPDVAGQEFRVGLMDARFLPLFVNYMYEFLLSAVWTVDAALQWQGCSVAAVPRPFPHHQVEYPNRGSPSPALYPQLPPYPSTAVDVLLFHNHPSAQSPAYTLPFAPHFERLFRTQEMLRTGTAAGIPVQAEMSIRETQPGTALARRLSIPEYDLLHKVVPTELVAATRSAALQEIPIAQEKHISYRPRDQLLASSDDTYNRIRTMPNRLSANRIHPNSLAHTARTVMSAPEPVGGVQFTSVSTGDASVYLRELDNYLRQWNYGLALQHTIQMSSRSALLAGALGLLGGCLGMVKRIVHCLNEGQGIGKCWQLIKNEGISATFQTKQAIKSAAIRGLCIGATSSALCLWGGDPVLQESMARVIGSFLYENTFNFSNAKQSVQSTIWILKEEILTEILQQGAQHYIIPILFKNIGKSNDGILAWHPLSPLGAAASIPLYIVCRTLGKYL